MLDSEINYDFVKESFWNICSSWCKQTSSREFDSYVGNCRSATGIQNHSMTLETDLLTKINVNYCNNFYIIYIFVLECGTVILCHFYPLNYSIVRQASPPLLLDTSLHFQYNFTHNWNMSIFKICREQQSPCNLGVINLFLYLSHYFLLIHTYWPSYSAKLAHTSEQNVDLILKTKLQTWCHKTQIMNFFPITGNYNHNFHLTLTIETLHNNLLQQKANYNITSWSELQYVWDMGSSVDSKTC